MRGSIYEVAGGMDALTRLAPRWHDLALVDPLVAHPFSHGYAEDHVERLATYLAEALGGPPADTERFGPAAQVDRIHAGSGAHEDLNHTAVAVFSRAVDTAEIPEPAAQALQDNWEWATFTVIDEFPGSVDDVPADRPVHACTWEGPATSHG